MTRDRTPVAIFARAPAPGEAKTRLARVLGPEAAARLAAAFLEDLVARLAPRFEVVLFGAGDLDHPTFEALARRHGLARRPQPAGDLGARMAGTLEALVATHGRGLLVGSDLPTLPDRVLAHAERLLVDADLVLGPSADGGYFLVGARERVPPVFEGVAWSGPEVLAQTLGRARHLAVACTEPWYDVDTPRDLDLLRAHLALDPGAAPRTAAILL